MRDLKLSHAPKNAITGLSRAPGARWWANPNWQWKTSLPILSRHSRTLHILRYNGLSTVYVMADDPQPKKIPLIFFRTLIGSEPVREWLKELPEEERQA